MKSFFSFLTFAFLLSCRQQPISQNTVTFYNWKLPNEFDTTNVKSVYFDITSAQGIEDPFILLTINDKYTVATNHYNIRFMAKLVCQEDSMKVFAKIKGVRDTSFYIKSGSPEIFFGIWYGVEGGKYNRTIASERKKMHKDIFINQFSRQQFFYKIVYE